MNVRFYICVVENNQLVNFGEGPTKTLTAVSGRSSSLALDHLDVHRRARSGLNERDERGVGSPWE